MTRTKQLLSAMAKAENEDNKSMRISSTYKGCPTITILFCRCTMTKTIANVDTRVDIKARIHAVAFIPADLFDSITRSPFASEKIVVIRIRGNQSDTALQLTLWPFGPCPRKEPFFSLLMPEFLVCKSHRGIFIFQM